MCTHGTLLGRGVILAIAAFVMPALQATADDIPESVQPSSDIPIPAFCFAPGTSSRVIEAAYQRAARAHELHSLAPVGSFKFQVFGRWSNTATDGSGLSQGDPTTLTWSVVPDGTSISGGPGIGDDAAPSNLRAFLNGIYGNQATWLPLFQQVFDRWAQLTGITYVYEPNDDGSPLSGLGGSIGVRSDIRIGGHLIDGNYGILAYNYYPDDGDMVIDTGDSFYSDTTSNSLKFRNTVAHEHGHGLGLKHSCPMNQTKLMEPILTTNFEGPQHDDVLATNRFYGDRFEDDDSWGTAAPLGEFGSTTVANLSVDSNTDTDVYSFVADTGAAVDVSLNPVGMTYLSGPQSGDGSCSAGSSYNSLNIQDLEVRVLDLNGTTELAAADHNGVGQPEVLEDVALSSGAGTYYVDVTGDSSDAARLYQLSMTVFPSDRVFGDGFETDDTSAWSATVP
jgi:hypothetical protein